MAMKRKQDWDVQLHEYIESEIDKPFAYGSNDCAMFVAGAVLAMTGTDLAESYRGKYNDLKSSLQIIKDVTGGSTVEDVMNHAAQEFGISECPSIYFAQRGDVVLLENDGSPALGIVHFNGTHALFVSESGLHKLPLKQCLKAWEVR